MTTEWVMRGDEWVDWKTTPEYVEHMKKIKKLKAERQGGYF